MNILIYLTIALLSISGCSGKESNSGYSSVERTADVNVKTDLPEEIEKPMSKRP